MNQNKQAKEKEERTTGHRLTYIYKIVAEEPLPAAAEPTIWLTCSY